MHVLTLYMFTYTPCVAGCGLHFLSLSLSLSLSSRVAVGQTTQLQVPARHPCPEPTP